MIDKKNIEIIPRLPLSRWEDSKNIRLKALREESHVFYDSYAKDILLPDDEWKNRLQNVIQGESWMVYASYGGKLIGMAGAIQNEDDIKNGSVTIYRVYVDRQFRGMGVSVLLMRELFIQLKNEDKNKGIMNIYLNFYKRIFQGKKLITSAHLFVTETQLSAVGFYKKIGFKTIGKESMRLGDGKDHIGLIMETKL